MGDIRQKLEDYLAEKDTDEYYPEADIAMMDKMMDFILALDTEHLTEDQKEDMMDIVDGLADNDMGDFLDEDEMEEAVTARKVKIKPADKRRRRMEYRKKRASLKLKAKKYRRTTKYKQWSRMKKRKAGQGKTARGKRIRKFM
jgi:predicted transcriptional regulator